MNQTVAQKLAQELRKLGLDDMAVNAEHGVYGDFTSLLAMPKMTLVDELTAKAENKPDQQQEILELRKRVIMGEFDG